MHGVDIDKTTELCKQTRGQDDGVGWTRFEHTLTNVSRRSRQRGLDRHNLTGAQAIWAQLCYKQGNTPVASKLRERVQTLRRLLQA